MTQYPHYMKSPAQGIYLKIIGPFDFISIRVWKTPLGESVALTNTESGSHHTLFFDHAGFDASTQEEFEAKAREALQVTQSFVDSLVPSAMNGTRRETATP